MCREWTSEMSRAFPESVSKSLTERMKRPSNQVGENQGGFCVLRTKILKQPTAENRLHERAARARTPLPEK